MSLFPRRIVQDALDRVAPRLSARDRIELERALNNPDKECAAEWELVTLDTFARLGEVSCQIDHGGGRRPDLWFRSRAGLGEFVADIACVSDAHAEKENPLHLLRDEILRTARTLGAPRGGWSLEIDRVHTQTARRVLALPRKGDVPKFVRLHLKPFIVRVAKNVRKADEVNLKFADVGLRLQYQPSYGDVIVFRCPVYTNPASADDNPLFAQLKRKADQLRGAGFRGTKGIIVCDGGCSSIGESSTRILEAFFNKHRRTVSFVAVVVVGETKGRLGETELRPQAQLHWNPHLQADRGFIEATFRDWAKAMPSLWRSPGSLAWRAMGKPGERFHKNWKNDGYDRLWFSSRRLTRLLAGLMTHEEFKAGDEFIPGYFKSQLGEGRRLHAVWLESAEGHDEDWIVFDFGPHDAAIAPFRLPELD